MNVQKKNLSSRFLNFPLQTAISIIFAGLALRLGCLYAAIKLHNTLLGGLFHAPLTHFDKTPTGRILSRFSKDIDVVDSNFPELLDELIYCAAEVISMIFFFFFN